MDITGGQSRQKKRSPALLVCFRKQMPLKGLTSLRMLQQEEDTHSSIQLRRDTRIIIVISNSFSEFGQTFEQTRGDGICPRSSMRETPDHQTMQLINKSLDVPFSPRTSTSTPFSTTFKSQTLLFSFCVSCRSCSIRVVDVSAWLLLFTLQSGL